MHNLALCCGIANLSNSCVQLVLLHQFDNSTRHKGLPIWIVPSDKVTNVIRTIGRTLKQRSFIELDSCILEQPLDKGVMRVGLCEVRYEALQMGNPEGINIDIRDGYDIDLVHGNTLVQEGTFDEHDTLAACEWIVRCMRILGTANNNNELFVLVKDLLNGMEVPEMNWLEPPDEY